MEYRQKTKRRVQYFVGRCLEDFAHEAILPSDPSPYRRDELWEEDDRVFFLQSKKKNQ